MASRKPGAAAAPARKTARKKSARPAARPAAAPAAPKAAPRRSSPRAQPMPESPAAPPPSAAAEPFAFAAPWLQWGEAMSQSAPTDTHLGIDPERLMRLQSDYMQRASKLWTDFIEHPEQAAAPITDARFSDPAWRDNPIAAFTARAYLLNSEFMNALAGAVDADRKTRDRIKFAVAQWVDAASPANFLALNPKAQKTVLETKGESLKKGLANLLGDIKKGKISQTDETAFEVGRNVATSAGEVVYENGLIQIIQYRPLTAKVRKRPFLMVPPCINKFYILDLQPENSFVRYAVEQGNTVFLVSWKNPHEPEQFLTWDDYLERGPIDAIRAVQEISGQKKLNVLGFCVGGTLLASALAVLAARGEQPAASLTLMTSLLDFSDTGVMDIFVDERSVQLRERTLGKGGLMPGLELGNTFSSLRPNDLVWNYVVSNYLEGKQPVAFDLLYWNGDSTNLPGPMYAWYLRNTYLENNLVKPGKLTCCGESIDLRAIEAPVFVFGAREDHIVPWRAAYRSARAFGPAHDVRFVMGASGHIAGSINPVSKNKRSYWVSGSKALPEDPEQWLAQATEKPGSWWADWNNWLARYADGELAAPKRAGSTKYPPIEPAPGRYVKEKA